MRELPMPNTALYRIRAGTSITDNPAADVFEGHGHGKHTGNA